MVIYLFACVLKKEKVEVGMSGQCEVNGCHGNRKIGWIKQKGQHSLK